jgi:hypothetical protein
VGSLGLKKRETPWQVRDRKDWSLVDHIPMRGEIASEGAFHTILDLEHRRAARSHSRFVLMLLDSRKPNGYGPVLTRQLSSILSDAIRDTDLIGWYRQGAVLGVLFTELFATADSSADEALYSRVVTALREKLHRGLALNVVVTLRAFPESPEKGSPDSIVNVALFPEISEHHPRKYPDVQAAADPA